MKTSKGFGSSIVLCLALAGCTSAQGEHAARTTNAVVKAARAVCAWVMRLPAEPFPAADAGAADASLGLPRVPGDDVAPSSGGAQ